MKTAWATFTAAVLLFACGCVTRPDWIEATLVTVDVSGLWEGRSTSRGGAQRTATLELHQEGPKVTGTVSWVGFTRDGSGPLEGRVSGEVFHFTVRSAAGVWTGEFTVGDDKMEGGRNSAYRPAGEGAHTSRLSRAWQTLTLEPRVLRGVPQVPRGSPNVGGFRGPPRPPKASV